MYFGQLFLSHMECYFAILLRSCSEQGWERAAVRSERDAVPLSVPEPNAVHPLWLERLAPHYLPILASIWGENAVLRSHFRGTAITRATHLNWKERLRARPILLCLSMSPVHPVGEIDEETSPLYIFFLLRKVEVWVWEMEQSFKRHM